MTRLLYNTATSATQPYNRDDDEPVVGLDPIYRVLQVVTLPQPDYDPATEAVSPTETITWDSPAPGVHGTLTRGWDVQPIIPPPPPAPAPDWLGFAGWLYGYGPMADAMEAARASRDPQGEPATTGLPAAMDEARLRSNYVPFALSWGLFLAASGLSQDAAAEIIARAQACNLPAEFVAALGGGTTPPASGES